jgi:hypothetical protein
MERTWAETFSGCVLEHFLRLHILLFVPKAEDPIVDDRRLTNIIQTIF